MQIKSLEQCLINSELKWLNSTILSYIGCHTLSPCIHPVKLLYSIKKYIYSPNPVRLSCNTVMFPHRILPTSVSFVVQLVLCHRPYNCDSLPSVLHRWLHGSEPTRKCRQAAYCTVSNDGSDVPRQLCHQLRALWTLLLQRLQHYR